MLKMFVYLNLCICFFIGVISCNGEDGSVNVGGASGGSIKLTTSKLHGAGTIESNGGKGLLILSLPIYLS